MRTYKQFVLAMLASTVAVSLFATAVRALPGYHINNDATAQKAVHQFAEDSDQFQDAVYQAQLDKNLWRLTLAAHEFLLQKPNDPERESSFSDAYWKCQQAMRMASTAGATNAEAIPSADAKLILSLYPEAVRDTIDAAKRLPNSYVAAIEYGQYLQYNELMDNPKAIADMLAEYSKAVALRPDLGETHYALANGLMSSGDYSKPTSERIIGQLNKTLKLSPRITICYFNLAAVYSWSSLSDYKTSWVYLTKFLKLDPAEANDPAVVPVVKFLKGKLGKT